MHQEETTKGQSAYEMRQKTGKPWSEIADVCGCASSDAAVAGAKKYARRTDLEWPITVVTKKARREQQRESADREIYVAVAIGTPIRELGTPTAVYKAMDRHADRHGLPRLPKNGERAYNLRADPNNNLSWSQIAGKLGYSYPNHATEAARRHAEQAGLDWPVPDNP